MDSKMILRHGFFYTIFETFFQRLNELTGYEGDSDKEYLIEKNEKYSLGGYYVPFSMEEASRLRNQTISFQEDPNTTYIFIIEIIIGDFEYRTNLTDELIEYARARNISDAAESIGTCAGICMEVEARIWDDFMTDYNKSVK